MSETLQPVTTEVAQWLATQPLSELPSIYSIAIRARSSSLIARVELHLDSDELAALAAWAEHLNTMVTVRRTTTGRLDARIDTVTCSGHSVQLWTLLDDVAEHTLIRILDLVTPSHAHAPVEVSADQLRQAVAGSSTQQSGAPETGSAR